MPQHPTRPRLGQISDDGTAALKNAPASGNAAANEVVLGSDTRLTNSRIPTSHTHPLSELSQSGATTGQFAKWNGSAWVPVDAPSGSSGLSVTQTAHGLAVGDVVRFNGTAYVKAQGNSVQNSEVVGVVDEVGSANACHIALPGDVVTTLSGLTAGAVYFLSASTTGAMSVDDVADGEVSKPVMVALSSTSAVVLNSRGVYKVAGSDPSTEVFNEPPAGDLDGSNTVFTLEFTPEANSLQLFLNGVLREADTDYTLSGVTITFLTAPVNGSILLATYVKA